MRTLFRPLGWAAVAATAMLMAPARSEDKPKPAPKGPTVMQRKLAHAQRVLEGIAVNDFAKITAGADDLMLCSQEAGWKFMKTDRYDLFSNDFQRNLEGLKAAAKNKNVDAAALAYVDMTMTCVKCHKYIREQKVGSAPLRLPAPAVSATAD